MLNYQVFTVETNASVPPSSDTDACKIIITSDQGCCCRAYTTIKVVIEVNGYDD